VTDSLFNAIASRVKDYRQDVFDPALELAIEIAREGREGRRIGTLLTIGQADAVMASSRPLILDPLSCHPPQLRRITDPGLRGTLKELAQLDGASCYPTTGSSCRRAPSSAYSIAGRSRRTYFPNSGC
jgi:diadenylate cyclase